MTCSYLILQLIVPEVFTCFFFLNCPHLLVRVSWLPPRAEAGPGSSRSKASLVGPLPALKAAGPPRSSEPKSDHHWPYCSPVASRLLATGTLPAASRLQATNSLPAADSTATSTQADTAYSHTANCTNNWDHNNSGHTDYSRRAAAAGHSGVASCTEAGSSCRLEGSPGMAAAARSGDGFTPRCSHALFMNFCPRPGPRSPSCLNLKSYFGSRDCHSLIQIFCQEPLIFCHALLAWMTSVALWGSCNDHPTSRHYHY
jgi:hypothetical protein